MPHYCILHAWKLTFCDLTLTWPLLTTISRAPQYRPVTIQRCYKLKNTFIKLYLVSVVAIVKNSKNWHLTSVWPHPWPRFSKNLYALESSPPGLSNAVCRLSLRCVVLEISGGGAKMPPPPTGRVGRQSPTGRGLMTTPPPDFFLPIIRSLLNSR